MFALFESLVRPTAKNTPGEPPKGLLPFYWFFLSQVKWYFAALLVVGLAQAAADAAIPIFIGRIIQLVAHTDPTAFFAVSWPLLVWMLVVILLLRPAVILVQGLLQHQIIMPGRQSAVSLVSVVWYLLALGLTAATILARADILLLGPIALWAVAYVGLLVAIVPRIRIASREIAYARSGLVGRIVDSYTNIATVKLFARSEVEDAYVREAVDFHTARMQEQLRLFTQLGTGLTLLTGFLIVGTGAVALVLWTHGTVGIETIATALPLGLQITTASARVAYEITGISEQFGTVHEGMETVAHTIALGDRPGAGPLRVTQGAIRFEDISFHYGKASGVIDHLSLDIRPGEKIGLVGRSGAGKSTLVNLLLRFYDLEAGRITIDGTDIAEVTQETLRENISMVTQDTSLLHRSILDNIRYGKPEATIEEVVAAAEMAHAQTFILGLEDWLGRRGYDAHVGERGVKLSGGQRQRIAIARVILKNAPILILDEATSALDSEVEAAIQSSLDDLMHGKTVIAIAHRLSTIARMDRLVILDDGAIVEQGSHAELLALNGHYAKLWARQSGGFLADDAEEAKAAE